MLKPKRIRSMKSWFLCVCLVCACVLCVFMSSKIAGRFRKGESAETEAAIGALENKLPRMEEAKANNAMVMKDVDSGYMKDPDINDLVDTIELNPYEFDDRLLLPYETIRQRDIVFTFKPHYKDESFESLTVYQRTKLEEAAYLTLKWFLEADLEGYRWNRASGTRFFGRSKVGDPNAITAEMAYKMYKRLPYAPYHKIGFADVPVTVRKGSILEVVGQLKDPFQYKLHQDVDLRLGGDQTTIAEVRFLAKCTSMDGSETPCYCTQTVSYCYDPKARQFLFLDSKKRVLTEDPLLELSAFKSKR